MIPADGKLLVIDNGAYGRRIAQIAQRLRIACNVIQQPESVPADPGRIEEVLASDRDVTHVALVHCETTTGLLNPAEAVGEICRRYQKTYILDAMCRSPASRSQLRGLAHHFLSVLGEQVIQGAPGFGFVIAHRPSLEITGGWARSLSLNMYDQWREIKIGGREMALHVAHTRGAGICPSLG